MLTPSTSINCSFIVLLCRSSAVSNLLIDRELVIVTQSMFDYDKVTLCSFLSWLGNIVVETREAFPKKKKPTIHVSLLSTDTWNSVVMIECKC